MRTSLTETKRIEEYLLELGDVQDRLLTEARILSNPDLAGKAEWQSKSYELIRLYGSNKLRKEISMIEQKLFTDRRYHSFQHKIRAIFKR
ncbi:MAG: hypothetical protein AAF363_17460 [Bacteroidota bacterium]